MYKLHGNPKTRTMRTLWLLEELELPYSLHPADPRSPEALAVSPLGKVPVLETEEGAIFDSVAQMTYLADRHQGFTHPAGSFDRARQDGFTNTINETFDAVLWAYGKHSFVLPEEHRVEAVKPSLMWQFSRYSKVMGDLLGDGPYVLGEDPTVPDILLAHCCGWALARKFDVDGRVRDHMNRMRARPAFRRAAAQG
ncbi:glutathione S-transferase family protein [Jannaschia marina]|uniref:glutathione S-transferase family protein n=1 Tax=Jannaschia marina TaxID=2741674 RepID=UPI0015CE5976|nr:glutathione S-transferase family protein [Jannaschia marina]